MFNSYKALLFLLLFESKLLGLVWPTPNPSFSLGEDISSYVQPSTSSNDPKSGTYGLVRNSGTKFHEGLDLFSLKYDNKNEALDSIFSVLNGSVAYINNIPSTSSYGRYIVLKHFKNNITFYTLYAHMHSIDKDLYIGKFIEEGTIIGRMGRSAGGYIIPKSKSHLHFEIGFQCTNNFQYWYDSQSFDTKNLHAGWNGMNLIGLDPLDFFISVRDGRAKDFVTYVNSLPIVLELIVSYQGIPDFLKNCPGFNSSNSTKGNLIFGWKVGFNHYGIPTQWEAINDLNFVGDSKYEVINYKDYNRNAYLPKLYDKVGDRIVISGFLMDYLGKFFFN